MNAQEYREFVARYKAQNPVKYEQKKEYFTKRIAELEGGTSVIAEEELHGLHVIPAEPQAETTNETINGEEPKPAKKVKQPRKTVSKN